MKNPRAGQHPLAIEVFAAAGQDPISIPGAPGLLGSGIVRLAALRRRFRA